ncbi:MAG: metallophosphoesterase [Tissierellales bacterium]|jgi:predicted phosphohydrolase|nr:metallophosphoesterase [Tissierellales bacterium]
MKIFAIGDLHMDHKKEKPMDIFGEGWKNHEEKIFENWRNQVGKDDVVLLPGDISWAMRIEQATEDLAKIDALPGRKFISKGNHDYWWESISKLRKLGFESIEYIHNTGYDIGGIGIAGARGWTDRDNEDFDIHDEKIYMREVSRLRLSLEQIKDVEYKIVMIHYPPFRFNGEFNEFSNLMEEYGVDLCLYGHLHGDGHQYVIEGNYGGIQFYCVSCDYINFELKELREAHV